MIMLQDIFLYGIKISEQEITKIFVSDIKEVFSVNIYSKFLALSSFIRGINGKRYKNKISKICIRCIVDIIKSIIDDDCIISGVF